ncbi:MAG: hypothetical protein H5U39_00070 [Deferribacterales bacterium]|nr:hypothetical protein [Deferribacterales bacterium]
MRIKDKKYSSNKLIGYKRKLMSIYNKIAQWVISLILLTNGVCILFPLELFGINNREGFNRKKIVSSNLRADFYYYPQIPIAGDKVRIFDTSKGDPERWFWIFGDGETSQERNPIHIFKKPAAYQITLQVEKGGQKSLIDRLILIKSYSVSKSNSEKPKADFMFEPENPKAGEQVKFIDKSVGNPNKRIWQFGYFDFSILRDPVKIFYYERTYPVTLKVENQCGSDKITKYVNIGPVSSNVRFAKSCSLSDVQAAIAQANPGDTVVVPNGTAIWNTQLLITKGIILKAATRGGVTIKANFEGTGQFGNYMIRYELSNPSSDDPFRVSGFIFDCNHKTQGIVLHMTDYKNKMTKIRIDNNTFKNGDLDGCKYLAIYGRFYGVADNNFFDGSDSNTAWRYVSCMDSSNGRYVWQYYTFEFGTEDNFYFEDNTFYIGAGMAIMGGAGGRYSFRYNNVTFSASGTTFVSLFDTHGNMGEGDNWSHIGCEFYGNTINLNGRNFRVGDARGGKHVIYNNQYINDASHYGQTFREEYHDSLNPPARHLISQQPQYISETYSWNEYVNGSKKLPIPYRVLQTIDYGGDEGIIPREDYNFFLEKSNFNGSSGIGVGLLSQRPTYCSLEGAAWWATDENKLYRWHNGRWELYYVPYTYPHPLRNILGR